MFYSVSYYFNKIVMKKILPFVLIFTSLQSFGGDTTRIETGISFKYWEWKAPPANIIYYTNIAARYKWIAGVFDSTFHVPTFATTPTLRVRGNQASGAIGMDTVLHRLQFYSDGWRETGMGFSDGVTVLGYQAFNQNPAGTITAIGYKAGFSLTTGARNTIVGYEAMTASTGGLDNTAIGYEAMEDNINSNSNTAIGSRALRNITAGSDWNVAIGQQAMDGATTAAQDNTAVGYKSLFVNNSTNNQAFGANALANTTGSGNSAFGWNAGVGITTGNGNIVIGNSTGGLLASGSGNVLIGENIISGAKNNTIIFTTPGGERFRVDSAGNFGIANTAPTQKLDVTGNVRFSGALMPNNLAGTAGQVLTSGGAGVPPTWEAGGGGSGDVTKVGTPVNDQIGIWTGDGTIEGQTALTFDNSSYQTVKIAGTGTSGIFFNPQGAGGTGYTLLSGHNGTFGGAFALFSESAGNYRFNMSSAGNFFLGTGATTAHSTLQLGGSFAQNFTSTATGITLDGTHGVVEVTATGQTITLPTAVSIAGRTYTVKLTASGSATVATTSSQTIDGVTTYSLASQYKLVTVVSNGANWIIVSQN